MLNVHVVDTKKNNLAMYYYVLTKEQKLISKKAVKKYLTPILEEMKTEPKLSAAILDIIFCWRDKCTIIHTNYLTLFGICVAVKEQNEGLGWINLVLGRWSPKWQKVQQTYLKNYQIKFFN